MFFRKFTGGRVFQGSAHRTGLSRFQLFPCDKSCLHIEKYLAHSFVSFLLLPIFQTRLTEFLLCRHHRFLLTVPCFFQIFCICHFLLQTLHTFSADFPSVQAVSVQPVSPSPAFSSLRSVPSAVPFVPAPPWYSALPDPDRSCCPSRSFCVSSIF